MVWYFTSNQNPSTRHPTVQTSPGSLVNLVTVFASMRSTTNTNGGSSDDENRNVSSRTNNPQSSHHLSSEENNGVSSSPLTASALQTLPGGEQPGGRRDPRYAHQDHATENDDARTTLTVETDAPDEYVSSLAMEHQPKVGGKFLGCCDYRRAVMILSVVTVITSLMDIVFLVVNITGSENEDFAPGFDDDVLVDEIYQVNLDLGKSVSIVNALEVIFGVVSLYGALHFKSLHLFIGLVAIIGETIASIMLPYFANEEINDLLLASNEKTYSQPIASFVLQTIFRFVWIYPSAMLIYEIRTGIMSARTYPREEFSCCCFYP